MVNIIVSMSLSKRYNEIFRNFIIKSYTVFYFLYSRIRILFNIDIKQFFQIIIFLLDITSFFKQNR